jgi:hypothetical protein
MLATIIWPSQKPSILQGLALAVSADFRACRPAPERRAKRAPQNARIG